MCFLIEILKLYMVLILVWMLFSFVRPFEEVVYPKGDADAVSISKRDFDLLQPDTFVNDTIIDFYVKYVYSLIFAYAIDIGKS